MAPHNEWHSLQKKNTLGRDILTINVSTNMCYVNEQRIRPKKSKGIRINKRGENKKNILTPIGLTISCH